MSTSARTVAKEQNMIVNRDRKMTEVEYAYIDFEYNTIDEAIERMQKYREELGGDAWFSISSDNTCLALMIKRPETDAEMAKRIAQEEYYTANIEDAERKEFERLTKKFSKT